jgi:hypothetical protein
VAAEASEAKQRCRSRESSCYRPWYQTERNSVGFKSHPGYAPTTVVVPLWYRLLRPMCPTCPRLGTAGTAGTLMDASTPHAARLGAERSLVQVQSPRLARSPLPKRAFGISGSREQAERGAVVPALVPSEGFQGLTSALLRSRESRSEVPALASVAGHQRVGRNAGCDLLGRNSGSGGVFGILSAIERVHRGGGA